MSELTKSLLPRLIQQWGTMRSRKKWRTGLLALLLAGLIAASELKGAPRITVQSPAAFYLLAQYKLAVGDTRFGLELLERAFAGRGSLPSRTVMLTACNMSPALATP